ncbi:YhcB family protein [Marinagarivorans cellulosilyticus]|uniref:Z-ring associated protein G n=1 Tax=Marinagarivorans cellulosilyticus TaxID=2721545 RepID=A0AAN2BK52_9GAMM|nr:DUF1043 family protein [Marinagarivorans cellulosilyticus]BCD97639.1 hypothetical protein MARGE09_P1840 [Marinagarivorans cellulosilyticus]
MISTSALIATSIICLIAGAGLGALAMRIYSSARQPKDLEARHNTLQNEYNQYQQNVAQHFVDTSRLIAETQQRQQQLREHLVKGALHLTSADISRAILAQGDEEQPLTEGAALENLDPADLTPPKDWAPKIPGEGGVLSEEFGLKEESEETDSIEVRTATKSTKA